jgi:L-ascorbate metabolism protein UlaG (beta-lactamase superfamily)
MSVEITWFGHNAWSITTGNQHILIDPFLDDSPVAPVKAKDVKATHILVSHGHVDHIGDAAAIANRTGAPIVAIYEIAEWLSQTGKVKNTIGMNLGGGVDLPFGRVKLTLAFHSSVLPDGTYGGSPAGFLLSLVAGPKLYFACDTALFGDMKLIGDEGISLAVLPIGDLFTMGPEDSLKAISLIRPQRVAPAHYNTWPPIAQDADRWAERVRKETKAEPVVVKPGESFAV